ncbi:hypothetical protein QR680_001457 [Steinernema hermaphroditum]|uniref:F-actin monooxygenase n=1 Tax=Steinernema hermaphroditum TaxID=289476 RepID=A0AA39GYD0_9BILA|nr:hypothetical protein QR680_001457 [Steinernema hermaphroditum]
MGTSGIFEYFAQATTLRQILQSFHQLCLAHDIDPADYKNIYSRLREVDRGCENSKAQKLFSLIDKRYSNPVYHNQKAAEKLDVLIVGAGPCGLRAAIECALLGAHVVVIEQRDKFTRNNVLHLWQFVIQDLKSLGAKIFYPRFCTGSIDHISIRQLQCILLKVALCLGVQVYDSVSFIDYSKPTNHSDGTGGWTAVLEPRGHILSEYEFDVLIGADGKRNTVKGFPKDCMRARLAIGITANFKNTHTPAEVLVPEISGVAFIFNQPFFTEMKQQTGVELENIVYYKDDTHYFVMSAMKRSLLEKHVLKQDYDEVSLLLSKDNIDQDMLCKFATQAADFATNSQLPLSYVTNGRGECDVAMFDFTAVYKAQHSTTLSEANGRFLLTTIVGDSLYEPFWPTGSGCARGFLGVFDSAWMIRELGLGRRPAIEVIAERERIYKLLGNANKDNMKSAFSKYTIDPTTRYTSSELSSVAEKVLCHLDFENLQAFNDGDILKFRNSEPTYLSHSAYFEKLRLWRSCNGVLGPKFRVLNFSAQSWGDGYSLAALLGQFRKDLVDFAEVCKDADNAKILKAVLDAIENEYGLTAPCEGLIEWVNLDEEERYKYIKSLMTHLRSDKENVHQTFSVTPRLTQNNYKKRVRVNTSNTLKADPIKRLASNFSNRNTHSNPKRSYLEVSGEEATQKDIERHKVDFPQESKPFTKRPPVEKLDPVKLCRVEQIISGQLQKEQSEQFHNVRYTSSVAKTRRLDHNDLEEMEQKLERTGMGVLIDRDKIHSMSSKEEKMMRMSAADARSFALGGFKENDKFKEIDSRLEKADKILKNAALSGVNIVSQIKGVPTTKKGPPPPTPPKSVRPNIAEVSLRANASEGAPRPLSMSAVSDSLYSSVNARRRQPCAICTDEVYLAEQLLVEKKIIHKRCFRCFYCEQPLRLGNYGTDRAITEAYGIRFYCSQHLMLSFRDKVAKVEKQSKRTSRASIAIVQPLSPPIATSSPNVTPTPSNLLNVQPKTADTIAVEKPCLFSLHNINSPENYKQRTIEKIQAMADHPKTSVILTPERAEYQCTRQDESPSYRSANKGFLLSSDEEDEEDVITDDTASSIDGSDSYKSSHDNTDDDELDSTMSDSDDFADCEEWLQDSLGDQLREYFGEHPDEEVTLRDAEEILHLYNKSVDGLEIEETRPTTPKGTEPLSASVYYTTRSKFVSPGEESDGEKNNLCNDNLLDTTLSELGARCSSTYLLNESFPTSRFCDSKETTSADNTQPIDATPSRPLSKRPLREVLQRSFDMGTSSAVRSDRARAHSSTADNLVPLADNSPEKRPEESPQVGRRSSGSTFAKIFMRKGRSQSKEPAAVTVVPVDPDHADADEEKLSRLQVEEKPEESKEEKISAGSTTCISILPENHKCTSSASLPNQKATVFTCSICDSLGSKVSLPVAKTKTPLSATPKNIQRVRKEMEKYRSNMEHELTFMAQEIQRKISETESRLQDVIVTGSDLEYRLKNNTGNRWTLERWAEYLQEYRMLNMKLEELNIRVREMKLAKEYGEIQRQMESIRTNSLGVLPVGINETRTRENATRLIALLDERQKFHVQRREINKKWESIKSSVASVLSDQGSDLKNFKPVFTELKLNLDT